MTALARHALAALALAAALLPAPAAARDRAVALLLPATGANVPAPQLEAAGDVLRAYLEATGHFVVLRAPSPTPGREPSPLDAAVAAREAGAALAVVLHVARLEATGLARVAAYAPTGELLHADQLGVLGADDLDPALRRLAEGLASGGRASALAEIDTVTAREEAPLRRMRATSGVGLAFGALMPTNRADPEQRTGGASGVGIVWAYDARDFLADVSLTGYTSNLDLEHRTEDLALVLGVGVQLPLTRTGTAPYLGVGAGYAWERLGGRSGNGLQGRVAAGLLLGRLTDVTVKVELGWFWNAFEERERETGRAVRVQGGTLSLTFATMP